MPYKVIGLIVLSAASSTIWSVTVLVGAGLLGTDLTREHLGVLAASVFTFVLLSAAYFLGPEDRNQR